MSESEKNQTRRSQRIARLQTSSIQPRGASWKTKLVFLIEASFSGWWFQYLFMSILFRMTMDWSHQCHQAAKVGIGHCDEFRYVSATPQIHGTPCPVEIILPSWSMVRTQATWREAVMTSTRRKLQRMPHTSERTSHATNSQAMVMRANRHIKSYGAMGRHSGSFFQRQVVLPLLCSETRPHQRRTDSNSAKE